MLLRIVIYFDPVNIRFSKILVPVDFTVNTEVAIRKALALCEGTGAAIHLLHVARVPETQVFSFYQYFAGRLLKEQQVDEISIVREKMDKLKYFILNTRKDIEIFAWISVDRSIEKAIVEKARKIRADLVIIGKNSHHSLLPFLNTIVPSRVADRTGITVLTVKPGAMNNPLKTVVVPIDKEFPDVKLAVISALQKKFRIQVRLVTFRSNHEDTVVLPLSLLNAYRILKNNPASHVSYEVLYGHSRLRTIISFCKKVNADMLIVNTDSETRAGWWNKHISDMLPAQSVLAVKPV